MKRVYEGTTRLQSIGICNGIKAKNLRVGDTLIWNFGGTTVVKSIEFSKTGKTLTIIEHCDGKDYSRRLGAERIVVVKELNPAVEEVVEEVVEEAVEEAVEEVETGSVEEVVEEVEVENEIKGIKESIKEIVNIIKDQTSALKDLSEKLNILENKLQNKKSENSENKIVVDDKKVIKPVETAEDIEAVELQTKENKKGSAYEKWLRTFIDEKGFDLDTIFEIEYKENLHMISLNEVVELIISSSEEDKKNIKKNIITLDFYNDNLLTFFRCLAMAYIHDNF